MLDAQGHVRTDIFKPRGDIHLNFAGTQIASLRIQQMLAVMLPNLVPVQTPPAPVQTAPAKPQRTRVQAPVQDEVPAPVAANMPPVVGAPLVAVVNAPAVTQAPAGAQQLVGQVQDLVLQHVAVQNVVPEISTAMEVEDEDAMLERLFFKRFGRALPEKEKEKENDVDNIKFVIDLTDDTDEMEVVAPVVVVKTEPIEIVNVANVNDGRRHSSRLERLKLSREQRQAITEFGKSLRKTDVIPEKEAPLAASNVIADNDTDMAEDVSVNPVGSVTIDNPESGNTVNTVKTYEQVMAEIDAAIADN
jgi:hypothetical protein